MSKKDEALKLALEALEKADSRDGYLTYITEIEALREELAKPDFWEGYVLEQVKTAPVPWSQALEDVWAEQPAHQEPVALKWQQAPVKTQWGDEMVVASVAIDKDHTVCLYCERDQAPKVEAMFAQHMGWADG